MKVSHAFMGLGCLLLLGAGCTVIGLVENPAPLAGPIYWSAATGAPGPTVTIFLGTTTPVTAATAVPGEITTTPDWTTVTPQALQTPTPYWVTTTPQIVTTTPDGSPPPTTTPGLPIIGYTTPQPVGTAYYRVGTFYLHSDVYIGGPDGLVVRLTGHETQPSPHDANATYHFLGVRVTNHTDQAQRLLLSDLFFIRQVWQGEQVVNGRWSPQYEPLSVRSLPTYDSQQLAPIEPGDQRELILGFVVPNGTVREVGLITHWNQPVEGGRPVWFYLEPDPLGPFTDAIQPPPPTPILLDDGETQPGSGAGLWPTTGSVIRGFGCYELYTGIDGAGFGCPPDRPWFHNGVDIANGLGSAVWTPVDGTMLYAGPDSAGADCATLPGSQPPHEGLGNYQRLSGAETVHYLGHLSTFTVTNGPVTAGQTVAGMGSTGCSTGTHLHWIVYQNGSLIDPALWAGPGPLP